MEVIVVPLICAVRGWEDVVLAGLLAVQGFRVCIKAREYRIVHIRGKVLGLALVAPGLEGFVLGLSQGYE